MSHEATAPYRLSGPTATVPRETTTFRPGGGEGIALDTAKRPRMDKDAALAHFLEAAVQHGIDIDVVKSERLTRAAVWLARLSRSSGISGYDSPATALLRGIGPALAYFALDTPRANVLADIGAGNGALGAGIAILEENLSVHLVDRAQRAYTACEILAARLALPNLKALRLDVNDAAPDTYDAAVLRALAPARSALSAAVRLVRPGGCVVAYHRSGDTAFLMPQHELTILGTAATLVPGLVATAYRV